MDINRPLSISEKPPHLGPPAELEISPAGLALILAVYNKGEEETPAIVLTREQVREVFNWLGVWLVAS
jgi:hypothetical protein